MIVRRSIQRNALKAALFVLTALLIGKNVAVPYMEFLPDNMLAFVSGAMIIALMLRIKNLITGVRANALTVEKVKICFPKNEDELKQIGVKSELDFAYAMMQIFEYMKVPLWGNTIGDSEQYYNETLFKKSTKMFENMYGRKPSGVWALDWSYIARVETSLALGLEINKVPYRTFLMNVSNDVKKYYEEMQYSKAI